MSEGGGILRGRPWLRAWLVVGLAAWATLGVLLVARANNLGLVEDITFSPYHVVGYAALLTLAVYVAWAFFRALRRGGWRTAFPPLYGGLGLGFVLIVAWVILDPIWQSTLGIGFGIEGALAPTRLLIPVALVLLAIGPVREAIAERAEPGLRPGELRGPVGRRGRGGDRRRRGDGHRVQPGHDADERLGVPPGSDNSEIWTMNADGSGQTRRARGHAATASTTRFRPGHRTEPGSRTRPGRTRAASPEHPEPRPERRDLDHERWTARIGASSSTATARAIRPGSRHGRPTASGSPSR